MRRQNVFFGKFRKCITINNATIPTKTLTNNKPTFEKTDRIKQYLKNMRKKMPDSEIAQYPYISEAGYYQYPGVVRTAMEDHIRDEILNVCSEARVFNWR